MPTREVSSYEAGTPQEIVYSIWTTASRRPEINEIVAAFQGVGMAHSRQQASKIRIQVGSECPELPSVTKKEQTLNAVRAMTEQGLTDSGIGAALGIPAWSVQSMRARYGIPTGYKPTAKHGTTYKYKRGCRCEICHSEERKRQRDFRAAREHKMLSGQKDFTHGASGYTNWGCRCDICTKAHTKKCRPASMRWRNRNPDKAKEWSDAAYARAQSETLERASRHYAEWTGPEMELASRTDLSAKEVALVIGRTCAAVQAMRRKLRSDPKTVNAAGLPRR